MKMQIKLINYLLAEGKSTMKTILVILMNILSVCFLPNTSKADEANKDVYVYVMAVSGENVFLIKNGASGNKEKIRIKECIYPGNIIEIGNEATITLACSSSGRILVKTHPNSPYTVNMKEFEWDRSVVKTLIEFAKRAIGGAIFPDEAGQSRNLMTRTFGLHNCLWPPDEAKILTTKEPITFKWILNGSSFSLEIKDDKDHTIYSKKTSANKIDVPIKRFKPGRKYTWLLKKEGKDIGCKTIFTLLPEGESSRIMKTLDDISSLLPKEIDRETKCRLQAGYLRSEDIAYDAWQLLERNGITQEQTKKNDR